MAELMKHIQLFEAFSDKEFAKIMKPKRTTWASTIDKQGNIKPNSSYKRITEKYTDSDIPVFDNHPDWKRGESWEGNSGDINFTYLDDDFEIIAEFWDPDGTYTVGFRELGDRYIVPEVKRYQVGGLKTMEEIVKAIDEMMTFLEKY